MAVKGKLNRRSFLGKVTGGLVLSGSFSAIVSARGPVETGVSDIDVMGPDNDGGGQTGDRQYHGDRGELSTGLTDRDSGADGDPNGWGNRGNTGLTDIDSGAGMDLPDTGRGEGRTGQTTTGETDADRAPNNDPPERGRGTRCSDDDEGSERDSPYYGQDCTTTNRRP
jgi:hypothetical protein